MSIEITVAEYFEQLLLMEQQYGQEEDLYSWIYMLLQMAEYRKKNNNKEYNKVSIRDVHKAQPCSYLNYKEQEQEAKWYINRMLTKRVGSPDFAVFDNANKCVGAVEIKIIGELFDLHINNENSNIFNEGVKYTYLLGYFRAHNIEQADIDVINKYKYKNNITIENYGKQIKIISENLDILEGCVDDLLKNGSKKLIEKFKEYDESCKKEKGIWSLIYKNSYFKKCSKQFQLLGHVDKFNKVIYTNGLEFYYLEKGELIEDKYNIGYVRLVDLTKEYNDYKQSKEKNEEYNINSANAKWNNLIQILEKINWYEEKNIDAVKTYIKSLGEEIITAKEG